MQKSETKLWKNYVISNKEAKQLFILLRSYKQYNDVSKKDSKHSLDLSRSNKQININRALLVGPYFSRKDLSHGENFITNDWS